MTTSTARPRAEEKVPPSSSDVVAAEVEMIPKEISGEAAVLGSMILDPQVIGSVLMILKSPDAFFDESNRTIFVTLSAMYEKNIPVDAMTLHRTLSTKKKLSEVGGIEKISQLAQSVPTSTHAEYYATLVLEAWMKRRLISAHTSCLREVYDSPDNAKALVDRSEAKIFELANDHPSGEGTTKIGEGMYDAIEAIMDRQQGELTGLASGFIELDNLTAGFQNGDMIVLAARPSVGKTSLAMDILAHVSGMYKTPVGLLSMEMNKNALCQRLICSHAGVDSQKLRRGYMSADDRIRLGEAVQALNDIPFFIDDAPSLTAMDARTRIRRMVRDKGVKMVAIDYVQLMQAGKKCESRQQEVTYISACIKALTRELNIPILVLSQLNRASESENRLPRSSDLRESGSLEQDADVVMLLHRESVQRRGDELWMQSNQEKLNEALLILSKQRNGASGVVKLTFLEKCTRFENYNPGVLYS